MMPNDQLVTNFNELAEIAYTGEVIDFDTKESYDPDGTIVEYYWDFGDETNATGRDATNEYSEKSNCTVILTLTDNDCASSFESALKIVEAEEKLSDALYVSLLGVICVGAIAFPVTLHCCLVIRKKRRMS